MRREERNGRKTRISDELDEEGRAEGVTGGRWEGILNEEGEGSN